MRWATVALMFAVSCAPSGVAVDWPDVESRLALFALLDSDDRVVEIRLGPLEDLAAVYAVGPDQRALLAPIEIQTLVEAAPVDPTRVVEAELVECNSECVESCHRRTLTAFVHGVFGAARRRPHGADGRARRGSVDHLGGRGRRAPLPRGDHPG